MQDADESWRLTQEAVPAPGLLVLLRAAGSLWEFLQTQPDQTVRLPWSTGARPCLQDRGALDAVMIRVGETVVVDRQAERSTSSTTTGKPGITS